jgi:hypothetical protein
MNCVKSLSTARNFCSSCNKSPSPSHSRNYTRRLHHQRNNFGRFITDWALDKMWGLILQLKDPQMYIKCQKRSAEYIDAWQALHPSAHCIDVVIKSKGFVPTEKWTTSRFGLAVTLLARIREAPDSNLGRYSSYPEMFDGFLSPSTQMPGSTTIWPLHILRIPSLFSINR